MATFGIIDRIAEALGFIPAGSEATLESQIASLKEKNRLLQQQLANANSTISQLQNQISVLTQELASGAGSSSAIQALQQQLQSDQSTIQSLNQQIQSLQQQLQNAPTQQEVATLQSQVSSLTSQIQQYQTQIQSLTSQIQQYQSQIASLQSQIEQDASQISSLQNTISQLETELQHCGKSTRYSCVGGVCVPDPNGQYASISQCQANCKKTSQQKLLNISASQGGTVSPSGQINITNAFRDLKITATPLSGYEFSGWQLNGQNISAQNPLYLSSILQYLHIGTNYLVALFSQKTTTTQHTYLNISSSPSYGGTTNPSGQIDITDYVGRTPYGYGGFITTAPRGFGTFTITAIPASDYKFEGWQINGTMLNITNTTLQLSQILSYIRRGTVNYLVALFRKSTTITTEKTTLVVSAQNGGSVSPSGTIDITNYLRNPSALSFTATPATGYLFDGWQINGKLLTLSQNIRLTDILQYINRGTTNYLVALFSKIRGTTQHTIIDVTASQGGTVSPSGPLDITNISPVNLSRVVFSATPMSGYQFSNWQLNGQTVSSVDKLALSQIYGLIKRGQTNTLVALFRKISSTGLIPEKITISGPTSYTGTKTSGTYTITVYSADGKTVPYTSLEVQLYADNILKQQSIVQTNEDGKVFINVSGQEGVGFGKLTVRSLRNPSVSASISWTVASA